MIPSDAIPFDVRDNPVYDLNRSPSVPTVVVQQPPPPVLIGSVVVTDIKMTFNSMVNFMVKWAFASIPALFIIMMIIGLFVALIAGFLSLNYHMAAR